MLGGDEWSDECSVRFNTSKGVPGTHRIGDWVMPSVGMDEMVN
jgi:hypothetical protein